MTRPLCTLTGALLVSLVASTAFGYCRTTTCSRKNPPPECDPGTVVDGCQLEGIPIAWPSRCISFSVQQDGSPRRGITANQFEARIARAFDTWLSVDCGEGSTPGLAVETYPQVECGEITYNVDGPNQNLWAFSDDDWPYGTTGDGTIALTMVTFNYETGDIMDVDVIFNSYLRDFALDTTEAGDDLMSVIQHESGHVLGLAHTNVTEATMYPFYGTGSTMRTLDADDVAGICAVYPPREIPESCDADPRHGFTTQCSEPTEEACCAIAPGARSKRTALGVGLVALLALTRLRRRARRLA